MASLIADVDGELALNATDSGPSEAARDESRSATVSSPSSQVICSHPGSAESLGLVRLSGCSSLDRWATISGAALPFKHRALPVGWDGSGRRATRVPSVTSARAPQRDTHNGQ